MPPPLELPTAAAVAISDADSEEELLLPPDESESPPHPVAANAMETKAMHKAALYFNSFRFLLFHGHLYSRPKAVT